MGKGKVEKNPHKIVEMQDDRISHIADAPRCANIKSRKDSNKRCVNTATHGEFCGIHYKHPRPWTPSTPETIGARVRHRKHFTLDPALATVHAAKIKAWWNFYNGLKRYQLHGPAYWMRDICTNDSDFFSTDALMDISGYTFFSYKDADNHVYGFDIRSIYTLLHRARVAGEPAQNPFNRAPFPSFVPRRVQRLVRRMQRYKFPTEWAPLEPPTPEQQIRMKIVDVFSKIDELNHYSNPDWFIDLDADDHRAFYSALYDIWTHRANLTIGQKNTIVPGFQGRLFRIPRWSLADQTLEGLQKLNLNVIRMLISSATDRNDRILGAMYAVSALTLVSDGARAAYPWLHESVQEPAAPLPLGRLGADRRPALAGLLGIGWLQDLLALRAGLEDLPGGAPGGVPPLRLPPPADPRDADS